MNKNVILNISKSTQILVFVFNFSISDLGGLLFRDLGLQSANYLATVNVLTENKINQLKVGGWAAFRRGGLEPHLFRTLLNLTVSPDSMDGFEQNYACEKVSTISF